MKLADQRKLEGIYRELIRLEYILDKGNQNRGRDDPLVKEAWGHAMNLKGRVIDLVGYWQPTLVTIFRGLKMKEIDPSHRRRSQSFFIKVKE